MRTRPSAIVASLAISALVGSLSGCLVTATKASTLKTHADEANFRQVWSRDWTAVNAASDPWNPVGSAPGVCDDGGNVQSCYDTDIAVVTQLTRLATDLPNAEIPPQRERGVIAMQRALTSEINGLNARDQSIQNKDNASFTEAQQDLKTAGEAMFRAYELFPDDDRPVPALFGSGRRYS